MDNEKIHHQNLILIGMPAVGKSTLGVLLAKKIGFAFIDTDLLIQTGEGKSLRRIIHEQGTDVFCDIESEYVEQLSTRCTVIATGGSVVYRAKAMDHLTAMGTIVFLEIQLAPLTRRLKQLDNRGVVRAPGQTIEEIYAERQPLYHKYAQVTVDCSDRTPEEIVTGLLAAIR